MKRKWWKESDGIKRIKYHQDLNLDVPEIKNKADINIGTLVSLKAYKNPYSNIAVIIGEDKDDWIVDFKFVESKGLIKSIYI